MKLRLALAIFCFVSLIGCSRSKLTPANYDAITTGMSKGQVEHILGPPTTKETKDMILFSKSTWRYEEGKKFVMLTFKNDQLDSKEGNIDSAR